MKVFSFRRRTIEIVHCRYGFDIEAETYEEALQKLAEQPNDWQLEKEEQGDVIVEELYYLGIREDGSLLPKEQRIER